MGTVGQHARRAKRNMEVQRSSQTSQLWTYIWTLCMQLGDEPTGSVGFKWPTTIFIICNSHVWLSVNLMLQTEKGDGFVVACASETHMRGGSSGVTRFYSLGRLVSQRFHRDSSFAGFFIFL